MLSQSKEGKTFIRPLVCKLAHAPSKPRTATHLSPEPKTASTFNSVSNNRSGVDDNDADADADADAV
jgi:hypothetical protein